MMNYYNGFDALDAKEYDALMEELMQNDIADENAAYYFENELEKDGEGR